MPSAGSPNGVLLVLGAGADLGALQRRVAEPHVHADLDGAGVGLQRRQQRLRQSLNPAAARSMAWFNIKRQKLCAVRSSTPDDGAIKAAQRFLRLTMRIIQRAAQVSGLSDAPWSKLHHSPPCIQLRKTTSHTAITSLPPWDLALVLTVVSSGVYKADLSEDWLSQMTLFRFTPMGTQPRHEALFLTLTQTHARIHYGSGAMSAFS